MLNGWKMQNLLKITFIYDIKRIKDGDIMRIYYQAFEWLVPVGLGKENM